MSESEKYDIFLSYEPEIEPSILKLYDVLTEVHGFKCWMHVHSIGTDSLQSDQSENISNSRVFVSCITKKYVETQSCIRDITYADINGINMEILMFERLLIDNLGEIGFIIGPLVRHNVYKSSDLLKNWSGDQFDNILKSIERSIANASEKKQANNHLLANANSLPQIPAQKFIESQSNNLNKNQLDPLRLEVTTGQNIIIPEPRFPQNNIAVNNLVLRDVPIQMHCQNCKKTVLTFTKKKAGFQTFLVCFGLAWFGCCLGCCLIPFCVDELKDVEHYCPKCNRYLGIYTRK